MESENIGMLIVVLLALAFCIFAGLGWIKNLIAFSELDFKEPYKAEIVRGIGIPFGVIGAVEGFIRIEDK